MIYMNVIALGFRKHRDHSPRTDTERLAGQSEVFSANRVISRQRRTFPCGMEVMGPQR